MVKKLSFLLLILNLSVGAQSWEFVSSYDLGQKVTSADVGVLGKVYLGTERGNVYRFLPDGSSDTDYSSAIFQPVTSIDASNSLRVFVFYKSVSQFEFLERFSAFPRTYHLNNFDLKYAEAAVLGSNNTIWLLIENEVVQINPLDHSILFRFDLGENRSLTKNLGPDRTKIERMLESVKAGRSFQKVGFSLAGKYQPEEPYLKYRIEDGSYGRIQWPVADFSFLTLARDYVHFVKGDRLFVYQLKE